MNVLKIQEVILKFLPELLSLKRIWIGYSGGVDSHVLLDTLVCLRQIYPQLSLEAVHVHHGLLSEADQWAKHGEQICASLGVCFQCIRVRVIRQKNQSLEEAAREARYQAFKTLLSEQEVFVVAHHQDDQAETGLFHFLRGSGLRGLASMPMKMPLGKGTLLRPFLTVSREEILRYAGQKNLQWMEDTSNHDIRFSRNFLRYHVIPILKERWPALSQSIMRVASHAALSETLLQDLAEIDLSRPSMLEADTLNLTLLRQLSFSRQKNLIRYWIGRKGFLMPTARQLEQLINQVNESQPEAKLCVRWKGVEMHVYRDRLHAFRALPILEKNVRIAWNNLEEPLVLPNELGTLFIERKAGEGIDLNYAQKLSVRFRQGGEMWKFHGHTRSLKKCFQEWGVPPWMRERVPLIYFDHQLISVVNYGISEAFLTDKKKVGIVTRHQPFTGK